MSAIAEPVASDTVKQLLDQQKYDDAAEYLLQQIAENPDAESYALLALTHYLSEAYGAAADYYEKALAEEPDNPEWREMLGQARINAEAQINVPVPDIYYFERDQLLAKPVVQPGALPPPPPPAPRPVCLNEYSYLSAMFWEESPLWAPIS